RAVGDCPIANDTMAMLMGRCEIRSFIINSLAAPWCTEINGASVSGRVIECLQSQSITEQLPEMTTDLADVNARIKQAVADGQLIESSAKNIRTLLEGAGSDVYFRSVEELVRAAEW